MVHWSTCFLAIYVTDQDQYYRTVFLKLFDFLAPSKAGTSLIQFILRVLFCVQFGARHFAQFMAFVILMHRVSVQAEEYWIHSGPNGH